MQHAHREHSTSSRFQSRYSHTTLSGREHTYAASTHESPDITTAAAASAAGCRHWHFGWRAKCPPPRWMSRLPRSFPLFFSVSPFSPLILRWRRLSFRHSCRIDLVVCALQSIYMDAMGFGMGSCCLQVTFQARHVNVARHLYDHLAVLSPIAVHSFTPPPCGCLCARGFSLVFFHHVSDGSFGGYSFLSRTHFGQRHEMGMFRLASAGERGGRRIRGASLMSILALSVRSL